MKQISYFIFVYSLLLSQSIFAQNIPAASAGEFLVSAGSSVTVTATLIGVGYGWDGSKVTYIDSYSRTQNKWDCPKSQKNGLPYMPWGLMSITVKNNGSQIFQFYLDFRDENWATEYYPSHDTYLNVDPVNYIFTLTHGYNNQTTILSSGQTYQIWAIWGFTRYNGNFGTPVFVQNQYSNSEAGGSLNVASETIPSGQWGVTPNQPTCNIGTNNERFVVQVGGSYEYRKHLNWNHSSVDYLLSRTVNVPANPFQQIAIFDKLQPTTIAAKLLDNGSNLDNIQFRDPWYLESNGTQPNTFDTFISPYNPTGAYNQSAGGVFLNQSGPPLWTPPYYSIQTPVTKPVGGYTAVFAGWSYDPNYATLQQVGANPAGYDQKAVVFKQAGATITAQYSYYTVPVNTTLNTGTYNIAGTLTVPAGVTLTLNPGATLNFPSGAGLVVNGTLVSNVAVFTSPSGSWNGITLNSSNGSSIQNSTISYATSPIIINTTNSINIIGCTINNSSFYGGDASAAAAIQVWNSSPTISTTTINGQNNSWNGVRFANNSSGSLNECTIDSLGLGNGVIIQGGSSPTIFSNTIQQNYYHGIIVNTNGTGSPVITSNSVDYNGLNNYVGIYFITSNGTVRQNTVSHYTFGIWCRYSSSPSAGVTGQTGSNTIINNTDGLVATDNSYPNFGGGLPPRNQYWGVCNQIYGNTTYDAVSETGSSISAEYNWWGQCIRLIHQKCMLTVHLILITAILKHQQTTVCLTRL
ncbi:MAG: right-handed parallel beta-helix repeat-containing protein [Ignavibacteriaceae bacterium]